MLIKTLIIIPARSGSKGIIDKNIRKLGQLPLFCWTARAVEIAQIDNALPILSTDSKKYAEAGEQYGSGELMIPFIRPEKHALDSTSAFDTARHAIDWFKSKFGYHPEQIMWLQPTSPFRSPDIIQQAIDIMTAQSPEAVIGCKALERNLGTLFNLNNNYLTPVAQTEVQTRRQDISPLLTPNGAMYLIKTEVLLKKQNFFPDKALPLMMDAVMSHDIDDETDWLIAQAYLQNKLGWMEN